ncbi:hypothetical protein BC828DRAFT_404007 [Blastocladiella britannica]|nr:hypothetical protein BC828DRAFT_404007 [Blastocladiella britannica]
MKLHPVSFRRFTDQAQPRRPPQHHTRLRALEHRHLELPIIDHVAYLVLERAAGATLTPDDALAVLNVLPATRAPSVLLAVLSRGFKELCPTLAIEHGHDLAVLPNYPSYILFDGRAETLVAAATHGDLPTVQLLWKLTGPTTPGRHVWLANDGFISAEMEHGHTSTLEWLAKTAPTAVDALEWWLTRFPPNAKTTSTCLFQN